MKTKSVLISPIETVREDTGNTPLSLMQPKKGGKISHLETKNPGILQKLMAMGVLPGMPVTLLRRTPSFLFEVDQTRYAVDREIADHIFVSF
ncbi:TPA: ferrous iron transport protein A [Methanosarcinaceae archaeon]|nr:ferrous iron transport protein A [Methanosarcinaceae archaeon]